MTILKSIGRILACVYICVMLVCPKHEKPFGREVGLSFMETSVGSIRISDSCFYVTIFLSTSRGNG